MSNKKKRLLKKRDEDYIFILIGTAYLIYRFVTAKVYDDFMIASIIGVTWGLLFTFIITKIKNLSPLYIFILSPFGGFFLMTQILPSTELGVYLMTSIVVLAVIDVWKKKNE